MYYGQLRAGSATFKWRCTSSYHCTLHNALQAEGLAKLIIKEPIEESSEFILAQNRLTPLTYHYKEKQAYLYTYPEKSTHSYDALSLPFAISLAEVLNFSPLSVVTLIQKNKQVEFNLQQTHTTKGQLTTATHPHYTFKVLTNTQQGFMPLHIAFQKDGKTSVSYQFEREEKAD